MKLALKILWQLPQTLVGLLVYLVITITDKTHSTHRDENVLWVYTKHPIGVSFGTVIIVCRACSNITCQHEQGHSKQSLYLGWLYLLIVGFPSITFNILTQWNILKRENYYKRFPENWADNIMKIKRLDIKTNI